MGVLAGYATFVAYVKLALLGAGALLAVVCALDWAVRTRRISPFSGVARFFRARVDPMMAPVERWVVGTSATALRDQMRSGPTAIGDCYWLEALVQAIEATGTTTWTDVRTGTGPTAPAAPTGVRIIPS